MRILSMPGLIIAIVLLLSISILILVLIAKSKKNFKEKANQIKEGMTSYKVISIMCRDADSIENSKYKWEQSYWTGNGFVVKTLYITVIFENDVVKYIDKNF